MVFTIFKMPIAFSDYIFNGFARSFNLGLDFGDGVSATFTVDNAEYYKGNNDNITSNAQNIIQDLILDKYKDGKVEIVGEDKVKITVPGTSISNSVVLGELEMKAESGKEADSFINGSHIKSAKYMMNQTSHGVYIEFTKAGKARFEDLTSTAAEGGKTIYIYLNRDYDNGRQVSGIETAMSDGVCYINLATKEDAKNYAQQINNSKYGINLSIDGNAEVVHSNATTYQKVICAVVSCLALIGLSIFFILKFKELGLVMSLALFIYAVLNTITLSLIPSFILSIGTFITLLLTLLFTRVCSTIP